MEQPLREQPVAGGHYAHEGFDAAGVLGHVANERHVVVLEDGDVDHVVHLQHRLGNDERLFQILELVRSEVDMVQVLHGKGVDAFLYADVIDTLLLHDEHGGQEDSGMIGDVDLARGGSLLDHPDNCPQDLRISGHRCIRVTTGDRLRI